MNWDAIGAGGEILGALAVLITVAYLARQISRSNELAQFNASKEIANQFNDLNKLLATDSEIRGVMMKAGSLTDDEQEQLYNVAIMFCNVWVSVQAAYDNGQIDSTLYNACAQDVVVEMDKWPNFKVAAQRWLRNYPINVDLEILKPLVPEGGIDSDA